MYSNNIATHTFPYTIHDYWLGRYIPTPKQDHAWSKGRLVLWLDLVNTTHPTTAMNIIGCHARRDMHWCVCAHRAYRLFWTTSYLRWRVHVNYAYYSYARRLSVANNLPRTRRTACVNAVYTKRCERINSQMKQPSHSSRREVTRSSQNEPSSSAACQWNVSTLTKTSGKRRN